MMILVWKAMKLPVFITCHEILDSTTTYYILKKQLYAKNVFTEIQKAFKICEVLINEFKVELGGNQSEG